MSRQIVILVGLVLATAACSCSYRAVDGSDLTTSSGYDAGVIPHPDLWPQRPDHGHVDPPDIWPPMPDKALPPPPKHNSVMILASEQTFIPSPSGKPPYTAPTLGELVVEASYPNLVHKPDFIDAPKPPNCVAYRWKKNGAPNRSVSKMGVVWFSGHVSTTISGGVLPTVIKCTQAALGPKNLYGYTCSPASPWQVTGSSWLAAKTSVKTSGGSDIPPFTGTGPPPPPVPPTLGAGVDLSAINPSKGVSITWNANHKSAIVFIIIRAQLTDSSEMAEIWCSQLTLIGKKTIPFGALAQLPAGSAKTPLVLLTHVIGATIGGATTSWGSYTIATGRGVWGITFNAR